jgi:hypothetical protein
MTIAISVNGARVVVPGTYSQFTVQDSLASIAPGPRNVVLIGEAEKGAPGSALDIRGVYFNEFNQFRDYYGAGPLVDAARNIFTNQASPAFAGSVGNVYVYKTNNSGLANGTILQGATAYGLINSVEYGESGNLISKRIRAGTTEVLPTFSAYWVPKAESADFKLRVSGGAELSASVAAEALPSEVVTTVNGLTGVAATGGALREIISAAQVLAADEIEVTAVGHRITIIANLTGGAVQTTFQGANIASVVAGDILYIPLNSAIKGAGDANVGAYVVVSANSTQIVADKISSYSTGAEAAAIAPVTVASTPIVGDQSLVASAEVMVFAPMTVTVDAATASGIGASLEVYRTSGNRNIAQRFWNPAYQRNPVTAATAAGASVGVTVTANVGVFAITSGAYTNVPAAGETLWVLPGSPIAGATMQNVGAWVVTASGSTSITARKVIDGGVTVAAVALAGNDAPFKLQSAMATTSDAATLVTSGAEAQVYVEASRQSDGLTYPTDLIGGRVVLRLSYTGSATATVSISNGILTTTCANVNDNLRINLGLYATLSDLVAFINTKAGYAAALGSLSHGALNPKTVLDEVQTVGIAGGVAGAPAYNGRIKTDYYSFKSFMDANVILVAFAESAALMFKCGLPSVEATATFLTGGSIGSTSDASILDAYDAALKINGVIALPLFSRDAAKDIEDGLTNESSTYTIDSIHQGLKSHVLTASNVLNRKERFGEASFHGSFEDAKLKAAALSSERIQMSFQMVRALAADGTVKWFQPWMESVILTAGRTQANLGTPLLRKSFTLADVKHIGDESVYSDTLVTDFDPDTKDLDQAIEAGLVVLKAVTGSGIRMESPDLSTRSRENDPKAWVYERISVLFVCDQVLATCRSVLDNYVGNRTTDVSAASIKNALSTVLQSFVSSGSLIGFSVDAVRFTGNGYECDVSIKPTEAIEYLILNVTAQR